MKGCQNQGRNAGPFLAPATAGKIRSSNRTYRMLRSRLLSGLFNKLATRAANAITLPDYPG